MNPHLARRAASKVVGLSPDSFTLVMATGIVSIASFLSLEPLARGFAYVALMAWFVSFTALGWRLVTTLILRRTEA